MNSIIKRKTGRKILTLREVIDLFTTMYDDQYKFVKGVFLGMGLYSLQPRVNNYAVESNVWQGMSSEEKESWTKNFFKKSSRQKNSENEFSRDGLWQTPPLKSKVAKKPNQRKRPAAERTTSNKRSKIRKESFSFQDVEDLIQSENQLETDELAVFESVHDVFNISGYNSDDAFQTEATSKGNKSPKPEKNKQTEKATTSQKKKSKVSKKYDDPAFKVSQDSASMESDWQAARQNLLESDSDDSIFDLFATPEFSSVNENHTSEAVSQEQILIMLGKKIIPQMK